jgi:hypothetical protein
VYYEFYNCLFYRLRIQKKNNVSTTIESSTSHPSASSLEVTNNNKTTDDSKNIQHSVNQKADQSKVISVEDSLSTYSDTSKAHTSQASTSFTFVTEATKEEKKSTIGVLKQKSPIKSTNQNRKEVLTVVILVLHIVPHSTYLHL